MVLNITSSEFSFLTFNAPNETCSDEADILLPVCDNAKIKAQFNIDGDLPTSEKLYVGICDSNCDIVYDDNIEVLPICNRYRWDTIYEDELRPESDPYNICNLNPVGDNLFENGNFDVNPFNEITTGDFMFSLTTPADQTYFHLYIENKIYVIRYDAALLPGITRVTTVGNLTVLSVRFLGGEFAVLQKTVHLIQNYIDPVHGTTTTKTGTSFASNEFTMLNMPAGSYLYDTKEILTNIDSVTAGSGLKLLNGFYNSETKKLNYYAFNTTFPQTEIEIKADLFNLVNYKFKFKYATISNINCVLDILDATDTVVVTRSIYPLEPSYTGVEVVEYFSAGADETYTLKLTFYASAGNQITLDDFSCFESPRIHVTDSVATTGYTPIPEGYYNKEELYAIIEEILEMDFDCEFTNCCREFTKIEFTHTFPDDDTQYIYQFNHFWNVGFINFPAIDLDNISTDCFSYCIFDAEKSQLACSNIFRKEIDCCYVSAIEYSSNENSMGFYYPEGVTNYIQLPFYVHSPEYPKREKIYKRTNGTYARLATDIEKEYTCESEYLSEELHNKLITALNHDTLILTSNRLGFTAPMIQQGDYSPDWNSKIDFTAMAEFKLRKYFNGKNNNCGSSCD